MLAPTLVLSEEEFLDPLKFYRKIHSHSSQFGIIKIVPPFRITSQFSDFVFKPRVQVLNTLDGSTRIQTMFLERLYMFHARLGRKLPIPQIQGRMINLFLLKDCQDFTRLANDLGLEGREQELIELRDTLITPYLEFIDSPTAKKVKRNSIAGICDSCRFRRKEAMVVCQQCGLQFHVSCAGVFDGDDLKDWYCNSCLVNFGSQYGFTDSIPTTLEDYKRRADEFKLKWFPNGASEQQIEDTFWRLLKNPLETVSVEYGADLSSSIVGSGFPNKQTNPNHPLADIGWNLNNIGKSSDAARWKGSLLGNVDTDISGMVVPWIYCGMLFSTFCWHAEDHFTASINYLHAGDTKTWYGIPSSDADKFEALMRAEMPELFESSPDLLFHITTMLSPEKIRSHGIKLYTAYQRPGEFVITFPRAYHAGFNQGFNIAEAANFAAPDWLSFGKHCVDLYSKYHKQPVFSHEKLVVDCALDVSEETDAYTAACIVDALDSIIEQSLADQKTIEGFHPIVKSITTPGPHGCNQNRTIVVYDRMLDLGLIREKCAKQCRSILDWKVEWKQLSSRPSLSQIKKLLARSPPNNPFKHEVERLAADCVEKIRKIQAVLPRRGKTNTLSDVTSLLKECETFTSSHVLQLQEHVDDCNALVKLCKAARQQGVSPKQLSELQAKAAMLSITFLQLEKLVEQREWMDEQIDFSRITYAQIKKEIQIATALRIPFNDPQLIRLGEIDVEMQSWMEKCELLLKFGEMAELAKAVKRCPLANDEQIDAYRSKLNDFYAWNNEVSIFTYGQGDMKVSEKPCLPLSRILTLGSPSVYIQATSEFSAFLDLASPTVRWSRDLRATLHESKEADLELVLRKKLESLTKSLNPKISQPFCFCRRASKGLMVQCISCAEWYHGHCVNIEKATKGMRYQCPLCLGHLPTGIGFRSLERLYDAAQTLCISLPETLVYCRYFTLLAGVRRQVLNEESLDLLKVWYATGISLNQ